MKSLASQAPHQAQFCQLLSGRWPPLQVRHTAGCRRRFLPKTLKFSVNAASTSRSTSAYSGCSGGGGCRRLNSRSFSCCRSAYTLQQMHALTRPNTSHLLETEGTSPQRPTTTSGHSSAGC